MASTVESKRVCYILKRFPRLSETFILNEIRALERLGTDLTIVSLLPREEGLHHSTVSEVRAPLRYLPNEWPGLWRAAPSAHGASFAARPGRYVRTAVAALWLAIRHGNPLATLKNFMRGVMVAELCRTGAVAHIHAHFANTPTRVAYFASMLLGIPFSFTAHAKDLYLTSKDAIQDRVSAAKFVLTCTRHNVEYLHGFIPAVDREKIHLVYHGTDLSAFSAYLQGAAAGPEPSNDDGPIILSVGRLVPKKGMNHLLAACAMLRDRGLVFQCRIVGAGPLKDDLQRQISELGLDRQVKLVGSMTHDELVAYYSKATVFALLPQIEDNGDRDGIPNVLVEAMAAGVPIVSTAVSGIPELIEHDKTGILVEPSDPAAAAAALETLLNDAHARRRIAAKAKLQLTRNFECWESTKAIHTLLAMA